MANFDIKAWIITILSLIIAVLVVFMLYKGVAYEKTISGLKDDISELEKQELKLDKKISDQKKAIEQQKDTEKENLTTISKLQEDLNITKETSKKIFTTHTEETSKLKKIIVSLKKEAEVTGDVHVKDCLIQIEKVDNDEDFIVNTISNIGF